MATSITGIVCNTDYNNTIKIIVFAPAPTGGVTVTWTAPTGALGTTSDLINSSGGVDTYQHTATDAEYDSNLGGYAVWTDTFDINNDSNGTITAQLNSETDTKTVNYVTKGYPFQQPGDRPQGMTITFQECDNGTVSVWANLENKVFDNGGAGSHQAALDSRYKLVAPSVGPLIPPSLVAVITDNNGNTGNWTESSPANLASNGTKAALFDLGTFNAGDVLTFRAIGNDGEAANDYLEESFTVTCNLTVTDGTGTTVDQGDNSDYTIPYPTSTTNCTPTSLEVLSIPSGSTLFVGSTQFNVGDQIPISSLTDTGSTYTGISEHTTLSTTTGSNPGATFRYETGCGESDVINVPRTVNTGCEPVDNGSISGNSNPVVNVQETLTATGFTGTAPFTYNWVVTGATLDSGQGTDTIQITPTGGSVEASVTVTNCSGTNTVTRTFSSTACTPVGGGTINGDDSVNVNVSTQYTLTGLTGSGPYDYTWSVTNGTIQSGQSTNTVTVVATSSPMTVTCQVTNCNGLQSITRDKTVTACTPISGGQIVGGGTVQVNQPTSYTANGFQGSAPYNYTWTITNGSIDSGQGTATVTVTPTAHPMTVALTTTNCNGSGSRDLEQTVTVETFCDKVLPVTFHCWTPRSIIGNKVNETGPNRVQPWTESTVTLRVDAGIGDYELKITDASGITHTMKLKNITC